MEQFYLQHRLWNRKFENLIPYIAKNEKKIFDCISFCCHRELILITKQNGIYSVSETSEMKLRLNPKMKSRISL